MRTVPQRNLLKILVIFILFGSQFALAEPKTKLLYEIGEKEIIKEENFFEKAASFLFGAKNDEDKFSMTTDIAVDSEDSMYVVDSEKARIIVLDSRGKAKDRPDIGEGILKNPIGIDVDSQGRIYVTDSILNQVLVFGADGKLLFTAEGDGTNYGKLLRPSGILADEAGGRILVSDTGNHRLQIFDLNGKFKGFVGKQGGGDKDFSYPMFIAKDASGKIYIVDTINSRVKVLDQNLDFISKFGGYGDILGYFGRPKGIAVDPEGRIYVSDALFNVISVFDKDHKPIMSFGSYGSEQKSLYAPMGIAVNSKGEVIVADSQNRMIRVFGIKW